MGPEKRLDHLHAIIERLAGNSFTVKGWAISVASGFLGFSVKDAKPEIAFVGLLPIIIFWLIDAYYLAGERVFRRHYNDTLTTPALADGPLVGQAIGGAALFGAMRTPVLAGLYLALIGASLLLGIGLLQKG